GPSALRLRSAQSIRTSGCRLELLDVLRRQLRPIDCERELVELTGELEGHLVVPVIDGRAGIGADVEVLVPLPDERNSVLQLLARHLLAVHLEHAGAAAADAAYVVKGKRAKTEAVILEVELQRVLAWRQCLRSLPASAFEVEEVVQEHGLAL